MMRTRCQAMLLGRSSTRLDGRGQGRRGSTSSKTSTAARRAASSTATTASFLPLYITCGGRTALRPTEAGQRGSRRRRDRRWAASSNGSDSGGRDVEILLRADASYAREEILAWCEGNGVDYVIGLARNSRLVEKIGWERPTPRRRRSGGAARPAGSRSSSTPQAGPARPGRRQGRAPARQGQPALRGHLAARQLLGPESTSASTARGATWRTRSRSEQLDLFSEGTSASRFAANQRILIVRLRSSSLRSGDALHGTRLARATAENAAYSRQRPRHGLGAKGQGRHGLRTPVGRRLRKARPSCQGNDPHPLRDTRSSRSSEPQDQAVAQAAVPATLAPRKHGRRAALLLQAPLGRNSGPNAADPQSPQR